MEMVGIRLRNAKENNRFDSDDEGAGMSVEDISEDDLEEQVRCGNMYSLYIYIGGTICGQVHLGRSTRYIWGRSGQVHFDPSSEPALRQCHETSLTFSGDRADFGQCEEVVSFFIGLFCEEKGTFGFLGALSLSKSPKSQKGPFSNKTYR